ncbi:MAG: aspartate aminotransferase family protein [Candidatus Methanomethylicia archaeon]
MYWENEFESMSFMEAPRILQYPGSKSLKIMSEMGELETKQEIYKEFWKLAVAIARGATIMDVDDNIFIDCVGGICVVNMGHCNPFIVRAVREQLEKYWHTLAIPSEVRIKFLRAVHEVLPKGLRGNAKILTTVTGADAIEAAVSLAKWVTGRRNIVAFEGAYHGIHHGAVTFTAKKTYQKYAGVCEHGVYRIPYPYPYRFPIKTSEEDISKIVVEYLDHLLSDSHSGVYDVAAVVVEPIQGEGGYIVPPSDFLPMLREVTEKHSVLLIVDEIQSGMGRTGKIWAIEHYDIEPDIIAISKSIANGIPLSLIAYKREFDEKLEPGFHLGTYRGNLLGMASAIATLEYMLSRNLPERASKLGERVFSRFMEIQDKSRIIGDVRGKGFMVGVELVKDKSSKTPGKELAVKLREELAKQGILMHTCGHYDNVMRFMTPLVIPEKLLWVMMEKFEYCIRSVEETVSR